MSSTPQNSQAPASTQREGQPDFNWPIDAPKGVGHPRQFNEVQINVDVRRLLHAVNELQARVASMGG